MLVAGAAVCAAAFAYASYAPGRIIAPIAGVAAVAIAISQSVALPGIGRTWSVALAALFVGLVAFSVAGRMRVPPLVVVVSAVVPMLPGLSIYRGLTLLAEGSRGDISAGLLAMVTAASVAIALSAGVILGEYVAQPLKREARRLETRLAGPRLVGPMRDLGPRARRRRAREEGKDEPEPTGTDGTVIGA
nr:threonine/serine exporter family protein [Nocardioides ochotonae]